MEGGQNFILEGALRENVDVLIRSIDLPGFLHAAPTPQDNPITPMARNKALVWQAAVQTASNFTNSLRNAGAIVACGLNLFANSSIAEAAWMLHKLLDYSLSGPKPVKTLAVKITMCPGCFPDRSWALCPASNQSDNHMSFFI